MKLNIDEMAQNVAKKALDECEYNGRTLRKWIDILKEFQWIPVSERLPEEEKDYLTSIDYPNCKKPIQISFFDGISFKAEVIAWMPLPEPYREEGEG